MDFLLISEGKLKLTLSPDDMDTYRLDTNMLDWSDTATRSAVWGILDEAKHRCGFDAARDRVMVQVFPSAAGGCEMFVTRVKTREDADVARFTVSGAVRGLSVYRFGSLDKLIACCAAADRSGYSGASCAYVCDDGSYLLLCREFMCASEFGEKIGMRNSEIYIAEHAKPIRRTDAIEILAKMQ